MAEVEQLAVRLTGDGSGYQKMMQDAEHATKDVSHAFDEAGKHAHGFMTRFTELAHLAAETLVAHSIKHWLQEAFAEYNKAEAGTMRLTSTLVSNGREVEKLSEDYKSFAEDMQKITVVEDDVVISMIATAETMGLTGDAAKRAAKNAVALSAAITGSASSAQTYLRIGAAIEQGNLKMLRRLPGLRGIKDETELAAKAQKMLQVGFAQAENEVESMTGAMKRLGNEYGDLMEDIGKVVSQALKPLFGFIREGVAWFKDLSDSTKQMIVLTAGLSTVFLALGPVLYWFKIFAGLFSPIGVGFSLVSIAVSNLVVYLGGLGKSWEVVKEKGGEAWQWVLSKFNDFVEFVQPYAEAISSWFLSAWEKTKEYAVDAWEETKSAAVDFWEYIRPVVTAGVSFMIAIWDSVVAAADAAWELMKFGASEAWKFIRTTWGSLARFFAPLWTWMQESAGITWTNIRDKIRDAFIAAEFFIRNFGAIATLIWKEVELSAVTFGEEVKYIFTVELPAWLNWFANNWEDVIGTAVDFGATAIKNMFNNIVAVIANLPALIAGTVKLEEIWTPITKGFVNTVKELPQIAGRGMGELEAQLTKDVKGLNDKIGQDWNSFLKNKQLEFDPMLNLPDGSDLPDVPTWLEHQKEGAGNKARDLGMEIGENMNKGIKHGLGKWEAADFFGAEALSRVREFREFGGVGKGQAGGCGGLGAAAKFGAGGVKANDAFGTGPADADAGGVTYNTEKMASGIDRLVELTEKLVDKPAFELETAGLS